MKYLARILFEDCICEILNSQGTLPEEDTEKFLTHVSDIIKLNQEPLRLCFSLLINASKLFYVQKQLNEEDMNTEGEKTIMKDLNNKLLLKVYKKLNSLVTRYFLFKSNKAFLDKDDLFNILFNLTHDNKYHRLYYMNLFISLVKFLLKNYELDLEYKDRRKVYLMVFEMIFELIHNILCYKDYKAVINTYCLLCSFLIEFIRTCDTSFEDYYFIYKSISAISFKLFDLVFTRLQLFMMYFIGLSILMLISM